MRARFLIGPAGSGKTFRCLSEIRRALAASAEGPPLLLIAPKQTTYQLERQFLADPTVPGYTRLHILSFERLAHFVLERLGQASPELLDEEGRVMVLRGLLAKKREELMLFRASARLTGFAHQLSETLSELQRNELTPEAMEDLAGRMQNVEGLARKLQDLGTLLRHYLEWLKTRKLHDADRLLDVAVEALKEDPKFEVLSPRSEVQIPRGEGEASGVDSALRTPHSALRISGLWVDGFAEWTGPELDLIAALLPCCQEATLTFCLEGKGATTVSWLSTWSWVTKSFEECRRRLGSLPNVEVLVERMGRHPQQSRFAKSPVLRHLEQHWGEPKAYVSEKTSNPEPQSLNPEPRSSDLQERAPKVDPQGGEIGRALRTAICAIPEAEAVTAAREILQHVRAEGRYRDVAVLVRRLEGYHEVLQRVFARYDIPYYLDRREPVSHHPLAELTRSALRTVALEWRRDDWFAALKTGLVPAEEAEIDELENEALARGWKGGFWHAPIRIKDDRGSAQEQERLRGLESRLEQLRQRLVPAFQKLGSRLNARLSPPAGPAVAEALREFWNRLKVEERLREWAEAPATDSELRIPRSVHTTVWEQMNAWLENVELAFPNETLPLREWLPILEAGLANLTVGVVPPALDQVFIGAIDRSRNPNPDIKLALVLGLNETVFPASPTAPALLTESDRLELERRNVNLGNTARQQLGRERYLAYVACTRASQRLVLTCALHDASGAPLNPSSFLSHLKRLFPSLEAERVPRTLDWPESEHVSELIVPLLGQKGEGWEGLAGVPGVAQVLERVRGLRRPELAEVLSPELAEHLYGPVLRTSVSRMEHFAACPFKFFVHSGLRAEERQRFELDIRERGSFQHDALACFHEELRREQKRWRDVTAQEARDRMQRICTGLAAGYREGLLQASEESRFMARLLTESLQDFVETLVEWMRAQYLFDPVEVELPFGDEEASPAWVVDLGGQRELALYGRIDRVDLSHDTEGDAAWCVVVDYKSSEKKLDPVLMAHGLQLQLPAYLNVVRRWPNPRAVFGVNKLIPAGVFYVSLRGRYQRESNRAEALAAAAEARKLAYRHTGRFDSRALRLLDGRPEAREGDQFNYRLTNDGNLRKDSREAMAPAQFEALLDSVEANLKRMGREIFSGEASVDPYRKGSATACDQCDYRSICRIDPWTHTFRVLREEA